MTLALGSAGLTIQSFTEALEEIVSNLSTALALTATQAERLRTNVRSTLGNYTRIEAERDVAFQEVLLSVYDTISWSAEGTNLDRVVALLGVERNPALASEVTGEATGAPGTTVPAGTRLRYNPEGSTWVTTEAVVLVSSSSPVDLTVRSESAGSADTVAVDPTTGYTDWTVLDTVIGFSDSGAFTSQVQSVTGAPIESDAALRARARTEAYRRAQGPLTALEASIAGVTGVTFVRAWDNTGPFGSVDADGIPGRAINVVVDGGSDADIVAAILAARPAGAQLYGTSVSQNVHLGNGRYVTVAFDRVSDVTIWIDCVIATSTSEEAAPAGVADVVSARLLEQAPELFGIGDDVLPYRLAASLSDIEGFDTAVIQLSTDDGAADPYSTAKRVISIRQRPTFAAARITVTET